MDERKEQARVREQILRVFKARAQSPGGGPAIIVNNASAQSRGKCPKSHVQSTEFPKYKLPDSDDDFLLSDTNASPANETMDKRRSRRLSQQPKEEKKKQGAHAKQDHQAKIHNHGQSTSHQRSRQRDKRRKSRAERNKDRAQKQQQMNPHEREEFRKHVKKAREITKQSRHNDSLHSDDQLFVAITQNRLTAGIYNQGRKSTRLYRDPLHVSERVTAAVEEEVKMIVDPSDSPNLHRASSMESLPPPAVSSTPVIPDRGTRSSSRSCKSLTRKRESESEAVQRRHSKSGDCQSSNDHSAQVLDMQDLSIQLAKSLDIKQLFPGKNYAGEIKSELQKLMKSNSAGKEEAVNVESVKKYMVCPPNLETVKSSRPVIMKQTPARHQRKTLVAKPPGTCMSSETVPPAPLHHAMACVQVTTCMTPPGGGTPHHSQDQVVLLEVPEAATASNPITTRPQNSLDNSSRSSITDNALEFLHFAETMAAECAQQQRSRHHDESVRLSSRAQPLSLEVQNKRSDSYPTDYGVSSFSSSSYNIDNRTSNSLFASIRAENPSVFSTDRCRVERQPDVFHDNVMSLRQRYGMDEDYGTRYSARYHEASSTDMLDHIGVEDMEVSGPSPFLPDPYNECRHKNSDDIRLSHRRHQTSSAHHYRPHTISQFEKCESDSESSPVWKPKFSVSPIKKPQLESPGAPELYPQKMF